MKRLVWLLLLVAPLSWATSDKPSLHIAVAANFFDTAEQLVQAFDRQHHYRISLSMGSTGALYSQIVHGAPFDLFFAADSARPQKLKDQGLVVAGSLHTYALGQLMLWVPGHPSPDFRQLQNLTGKLAIANPTLAPYGRAAMQSFKCLRIIEALQSKLIQGNNVAQTFSFAKTGNATAALVALSQLNQQQRRDSWRIPPLCYRPIRQQMVRLKRAADNPLATAFAAYVLSATGQQLIYQDGYAKGGQ